MKLCSGRWRVALGLGAALAIACGFTSSLRAGERGRPLFPWRRQATPTPIPEAKQRSEVAVLPEALTLDDDMTLAPVMQIDPPKPPASSTGQVPSPPPPLQKSAPTTPLPSGTFAPPSSLTPVPSDMGTVLGGPISGEMLQSDAFPLFYRDRPVGGRRAQAEIISRNRSSEYEWYKEWRCKHYGYYPTQWRPWPEGWHVGRNIPPAPYVHPYDLKQPDPEFPEGRRPTPPRGLRDQGKDAKGPTDRREPAPPLRDAPTNQKSDQQKKTP